MSLQHGATLRNAIANAYEATIGASPKLQLRSGAQPANCAAADSGTLIAEIALPSDWMTAGSSGQVALNGAWSGAGAAAGTIAHFRLKDSSGSVCHEQGTVTATGGGGDLTVDNTNAAVGQPINVTSWTRSGGNP